MWDMIFYGGRPDASLNYVLKAMLFLIKAWKEEREFKVFIDFCQQAERSVFIQKELLPQDV